MCGCVSIDLSSWKATNSFSRIHKPPVSPVLLVLFCFCRPRTCDPAPTTPFYVAHTPLSVSVSLLRPAADSHSLSFSPPHALGLCLCLCLSPVYYDLCVSSSFFFQLYISCSRTEENERKKNVHSSLHAPLLPPHRVHNCLSVSSFMYTFPRTSSALHLLL